jgi:AraC-like DNA-binding protein
MPSTLTSAFSEPEDFEAALRKGGCLSLLITGCGQFRAQLTVVTLHRLRLSAAEEQLSRIASIAVPTNVAVIAFQIGNETDPARARVPMQPGEIMILGPGEHIYVRTDGFRRWCSIWIPIEELVRYGAVLTGAPVNVPCRTQVWRPPAAAGKHLRSLHAATMRMAKIRPLALVDLEAAHGLEQQLIEAVIACLPVGSRVKGSEADNRHREIVGGFERLLEKQPARCLRLVEMCAALGVSERVLRHACTEQLGMSPRRYDRLRRMSLVRRTLRRERTAASVSVVARRYGFRDLGRFTLNYRVMFGELPSATLSQKFGLANRGPKVTADA